MKTLRSFLLRSSFGALMLAIMLLTPVSAQVTKLDDVQELFARGNQAYEEGRWADAVEAYSQLTDSGLRNATVYYNLGCALARQGAKGPALLSFRRALFLDPAHADAAANLAFLRAKLADAPPASESFASHLARWSALVPLRASLLFALILEWLAAGLIGWALLTRRRRIVLRTGVLLALVAMVIAVPPATRLVLRAMEDGGVVLVHRADARSGPGEANPVLFTVHEGYELRIGMQLDGWTRINTGDALAGWVPSTALAPVNPARAPLAKPTAGDGATKGGD